MSGGNGGSAQGVPNIVMILDLADPGRPDEVGRWWMPGQWTAGGETPSWKGRQHRCQHVAGLDWSLPFITPTHTALPVPFLLQGRRVLLVADKVWLEVDPRQMAAIA